MTILQNYDLIPYVVGKRSVDMLIVLIMYVFNHIPIIFVPVVVIKQFPYGIYEVAYVYKRFMGI